MYAYDEIKSIKYFGTPLAPYWSAFASTSEMIRNAFTRYVHPPLHALLVGSRILLQPHLTTSFVFSIQAIQLAEPPPLASCLEPRPPGLEIPFSSVFWLLICSFLSYNGIKRELDNFDVALDANLTVGGGAKYATVTALAYRQVQPSLQSPRLSPSLGCTGTPPLTPSRFLAV